MGQELPNQQESSEYLLLVECPYKAFFVITMLLAYLFVFVTFSDVSYFCVCTVDTYVCSGVWWRDSVCLCVPGGRTLCTCVCQVEGLCVPVCARWRDSVCLCVPGGGTLCACVCQVEGLCVPVCDRWRDFVYLHVFARWGDSICQVEGFVMMLLCIDCLLLSSFLSPYFLPSLPSPHPLFSLHSPPPLLSLDPSSPSYSLLPMPTLSLLPRFTMPTTST